ncbi:MAG: type II toxin-antitoxin system RelE/ParE family toxin [Lachnospiraceae bacterium]|nr:type II toxin-antitoxin system RelE/ParE family toxin [Lachnospiraceae bacterium]
MIVTWEAIYDMADIMDYIEADFGKDRADRFQTDIKRELQKLSYTATFLPKTQIVYRGYVIQKKPFPPSIIFYIVKEPEQEVHVLRVVREEQNWEKTLSDNRDYTYPNEIN